MRREITLFILLNPQLKMAKFTYTALDQNGQEISGEVNAEREEEALNILRQQQKYPTSIKQVEGAVEEKPEPSTPTAPPKKAVEQLIGQWRDGNVPTDLTSAARKLFVETSAQKVIEERAKIIAAAYERYIKAVKKLQDIKPFVRFFLEDTTPFGGPLYDPEQIKQRKALKEEIEKGSKAFTKALEGNDFGDLTSWSKGGSD